MATRIVRVLLLCTTLAIIKLIAAENAERVDIGIQFLVEPTDIIAVSGKPVTFHCVVERSQEPISVIWLHNGTKLEAKKGHRFVHNNGSLIFHKVKRKWKNNSGSDLGVYQCLAKTSSAALLSRPAKLQVADISAFYKQPENVTAYEGEVVRLSCQLDSLPAAKIIWTFQNATINYQVSERHDISIPGVLYIRDVRASDTGEYRCIGTNPLLNKKEISESGLLTVSGDLKTASNFNTFLSPAYPPVKTILENELLVLECAVSGTKNVNIAWIYKRSENSTESLIEEIPRSYSILKKSNINVDDSGTYTCVVSQKDSLLNLNRSIFVNVTTPPVIDVKPVSRSLPLALSARFTCKAYGRPQPVISWLHNGEPLIADNMGSRMKQTENELILLSTNLPDAGIYQCIASNEYGIASAAGHLYINDSLKPSSPIDVRCHVINSTAVNVTWDIPDENEPNRKPAILHKNQVDDENVEPSILSDDDSSQEILSRIAYTINYFPSDGGKEWVIPTTMKWTIVSNLDSDTSYNFYVRTFNGASGSDPSEKVLCSTLAKDENPEITFPSKMRPPWEIPGKVGPPLRSTNELVLNISHINDTTVQVSWLFDKPIISNDEYKVVCKKSDGTLVKSIKVEFEQKQVILDNLARNTVYDISLKIIVNGTEGDIATKLIDTSPVSKIPVFEPPTDIEIYIMSSSSIKVSWTSTAHDKISYYRVKYIKLGEKSDLATMTKDSKRSEVTIRNLDPNSGYSIQVEAVDMFDQHSGFSVPVIAMTPREDPITVENISYEILNSSSVHVSWEVPNEYNGIMNSYFISISPATGKNVAVMNATRSTNRYFVEISGLKPATTYVVQIYLRKNVSVPVGSKSFTMEPDHKLNSYKSAEFVEIAGVRLTNEQLMGVFIGIGISVVFIALCVAIICMCKRRFEKHYRQVDTGPHIVLSNEKHEMKVLTKGTNGYRSQFGNGCNQNTNIELPLLTSSSRQVNGCCQNTVVRENYKYYDDNTKAIKEEADKLLNRSSLMDETLLSALDTTNEKDHEGGDSGYCDRNHMQSPLTKVCDNAERLRKCSDITVDDGFYDGELPGVSGTSPVKLNTVV